MRERLTDADRIAVEIVMAWIRDPETPLTIKMTATPQNTAKLVATIRDAIERAGRAALGDDHG